MSYYDFNPFNKEIKNLEANDLIALKEVREGWYIDYKQETITIKKIAKHITAFANQFGGWLFFGIKESDDYTAGEFRGINRTEIERFTIALREAATAHSNPEIYYEMKIIYGPADSINLSENRAIIIICIPEGVYPPYVHSSGCIYRRVADQSDPKPETDRFILDRLWNKGKRNKEMIEDIIFKRPDYRSDNPILYVHLITNPFLIKNYEKLPFSSFKEIVSKHGLVGLSLPMNTYYSTKGGYIARQTKYNSPFYPVASIRWYHVGNALLAIPLNIYNYADFTKICENYEHGTAFLKEIEIQNFKDISICDINKTVIAIASLLNQYIHMLEKINISDKICAAIYISNTFQISPYIDDIEYIKRISENGIPIVEDDQIEVPDKQSLEYLTELIDVETFQNEYPILNSDINAKNIFRLLPVIADILIPLGIMADTEDIVKFQSLYSITKNAESDEKE